MMWNVRERETQRVTLKEKTEREVIIQKKRAPCSQSSVGTDTCVQASHTISSKHWTRLGGNYYECLPDWSIIWIAITAWLSTTHELCRFPAVAKGKSQLAQIKGLQS